MVIPERATRRTPAERGRGGGPGRRQAIAPGDLLRQGFSGAAAVADIEALIEGQARQLDCEPEAFGAVIDVEIGRGARFFDAEGRPKMLAEPHIASRLSGGAMGGPRLRRYPRDSYPTLFDWMAVDPETALKSCSWGAGQIMGFNHRDAGYSSAAAMVSAFMSGVAPQVIAMRRIIETWGLDSALRAQDWDTFARRYNGPAYAERGYHHKLREAYQARRGEPALRVLRLGDSGEAVEKLQERLGIPQTGVFNRETATAVRAHQAEFGLEQDGVVGRRTWDTLGEDEVPEAREPAPSRPAGDATEAAKGAAAIGTGLLAAINGLDWMAIATVGLLGAGAYLVWRWEIRRRWL